MILEKANYPVGTVLTLIHTTGAGCYRVISWSDTGTATLTIVDIPAVSSTCQECIDNIFKGYCQGVSQCCYDYQNTNEFNATITGYQCDGTWLLEYAMVPDEILCMAFVYRAEGGIIEKGCCEFNVFNPSTTTDLDLNARRCGMKPSNYLIPPLSTILNEYGFCIQCVNSKTEGPWEYAPCSTCLYYTFEAIGAAGSIIYTDCDGNIQEIFFDPFETGNFCSSTIPLGTGGVLISIGIGTCP